MPRRTSPCKQVPHSTCAGLWNNHLRGFWIFHYTDIGCRHLHLHNWIQTLNHLAPRTALPTKSIDNQKLWVAYSPKCPLLSWICPSVKSFCTGTSKQQSACSWQPYNQQISVATQAKYLFKIWHLLVNCNVRFSDIRLEKHSPCLSE